MCVCAGSDASCLDIDKTGSIDKLTLSLEVSSKLSDSPIMPPSGFILIHLSFAALFEQGVVCLFKFCMMAHHRLSKTVDCCMLACKRAQQMQRDQRRGITKVKICWHALLQS